MTPSLTHKILGTQQIRYPTLASFERWQARRQKVANALDAVVVGAPVGDVLLDGFGFEVLGDGLVDEGGKFRVRGEAEGDDLLDVELLDVGEVGWWEEAGEAEVLFEADDAVLDFQVVDAGLRGEDEECSGDDDPPEMKVAMMMPVKDGDGDHDNEIDDEDGKDEEVHGRIDATVILEALGCGHYVSSFRGKCEFTLGFS